MRPLRFRMRGRERVFLRLAFGDVAQHRHDLGVVTRCSVLAARERPAAHFDPDESGVGPSGDHLPALHAELDVALRGAPRDLGERGEIGRTIGDMNAVEQTMPDQFARQRVEQRIGRRRDEFDRAIAAMPRDDVAHIARKQAVAILLRVEQAARGLSEHIHHEGQQCAVGANADDPDRGECRRQMRGDRRDRQQAQRTERDQQSGAAERCGDGEGHDPARGGQRRLERNRNQPDRGERGDAAGADRDRRDDRGQRQRRQRMRALIAAGAREKIGDGDRHDQPAQGKNLDHARHAAECDIERERRQHRETSEQPQADEDSVARRRNRVVMHGGMQHGIKKTADTQRGCQRPLASGLSSPEDTGRDAPFLSAPDRLRANLNER